MTRRREDASAREKADRAILEDQGGAHLERSNHRIVHDKIPWRLIVELARQIHRVNDSGGNVAVLVASVRLPRAILQFQQQMVGDPLKSRFGGSLRDCNEPVDRVTWQVILDVARLVDAGVGAGHGMNCPDVLRLVRAVLIFDQHLVDGASLVAARVGERK